MPIQIERVDQLIANFEACLRGFDQYSAFGGQPAESHTRTLSFVRQGAHPTAVLDISEWYESLRDTLRDWNMDMRGAHLRDVSAIRKSFTDLRKKLTALEAVRLEDIAPYYAIITERQLWSVIEQLRVGEQNTRLVINTKAVHHLLPDLVPPMDRTYTFWFFFDFPDIVNFRDENSVFADVWPQFIKIARATVGLAPSYLRRSMHTSVPKMIDNAIIGYRHLHDHGDAVAQF